MTGSSNGPSSPTGAETTGRVVIALFEERAGAERAIRDLKDAGFRNEQIGAATQDQLPTPSLADEGSNGSGEAAAGALTGGVLGGLLGLISSLLVPGVGPLIVGGILASTIMGLGVGAATGGIIGALVGLGVPQEDAQYFDAGLRRGMTLVTVNATEKAEAALAILERHGADLGPSRGPRSQPIEAYGGRERRSASSAAYTGPERRLAGV
jgi:hypothetical protein